jgi:hypothetical protein
MTGLLLALYPPGWRARYGVELAAHLRGQRLNARDIVDLLGGALDAWLRPQWPRRRRRAWRAALAIVLAATAVIVVAVATILWIRIAALVGLLIVLLAFLVRRGRRRGWPGPGAAGAGVPARPKDPDPEPLVATRRR